MCYIYLLQSINNPRKSYVGFTTRSPEDRLVEHNSGISKYTRTDRPWKLVYYETFYCETCAKHREVFLKSGFGFRLRKLLIANRTDLG